MQLLQPRAGVRQSECRLPTAAYAQAARDPSCCRYSRNRYRLERLPHESDARTLPPSGTAPNGSNCRIPSAAPIRCELILLCLGREPLIRSPLRSAHPPAQESQQPRGRPVFLKAHPPDPRPLDAGETEHPRKSRCCRPVRTRRSGKWCRARNARAARNLRGQETRGTLAPAARIRRHSRLEPVAEINDHCHSSPQTRVQNALEPKMVSENSPAAPCDMRHSQHVTTAVGWIQASIMGTQLHTEIVSQNSLVPPGSAAHGAPSRSTPIRPKKKLIRRTDRDYSQRLRRIYQFAFLLMNVWLGGQFYLWVRHFETAGASVYVSRPPGVEGWLPIAGMMNLKYFLVTHHVPALHPAAMFLLLTFLAISFLFRKAFCSWLCPVGTFSEYLWRFGKRIFGRNLQLPRWIDIPLRGLKYLLLGFFVWAVSSMSANSIAAFMRSPYGIVADVKMLNFFRFIGETGLIVLGVLVVASLLVQNFWCRYAVPLRRAAGPDLNLQPAAHSPEYRSLHRLREVCEGLSFCAPRRQTDLDQISRMHRMPGVCGCLPRRRRLANVAAAGNRSKSTQNRTHAGLGARCRRRRALPGHHRICKSRGLLEFTSAARGLQPACAACKRGESSYAGRCRVA